MNAPDLNPREKQVLTALVDHYIVRAEPVSSSLLSQSAVVRASSATIRNTLADLEERGFVEQPHTSSGRLPTDRGYRTYVDELMHPEPLSEDDKRAIDVAIPAIPDPAEPGAGGAGSGASIESRLAGAAKGLADQTRLLGLVIPPPSNEAVFHKASLVQVEEGKVVLVVAGTEGGRQAVRSLLLDMADLGGSRDVSIFRLEATVKKLNDAMKGRSVSLLNSYIGQVTEVGAPGDEKSALDLLGRSILKLSQEKTGDEIFLSGARNLVNRQDFAKIEDLESVFELLESKVSLVHFLRQKADRTDEQNSGVHVTIGEERGQDGQLFRSLSLVTASFSGGGSSRGMVGVLGPKRIPYARLVPVVRYAAQRLAARDG